MIIHNPILTGSLVFNGTNLTTSNLVTTGSNNFTGSQAISGSLNVTGNITATTLVVQTVSSSVIYSSGSNVFGNNIANTQVFTGSILTNGSVGIATTSSVAGAALNIQGSQGAVVLNNPTANSYTGYRIYNDQLSGTRSLEIDYAGSSYSSALVSGGITGESGAIVTTGAYPLQFGTSNTFRMAILANGRVGIGTTSPTVSLTVQSDTADTISWRTPSYTVGILGLDTNNAHGAIFLYSSGSNTVQISAKPGAYTYFNAGNVGIGTSSPLSELHVLGTTPRITITNTSYTTTYRTILGNKASAAGVLQLGNNGDNYIVGGNQAAGGYLIFYVNATSDFITSNNGTEAMRITSAGYVCMNTTTATTTLNLKAQSDNRAIFFQNPNGADGSIWLYGASNSFDYKFSTWSQGSAFYLYNNGNYSFAGSNVSDRRLKENIKSITYNALEKIMQLIPTSYNMISQPEINRNGFIAQEVKEVLPDVITGTETDEEYLGLDYNGLLAVAIKAIQELKAEINELKNK